jgi:hypothetical protein
MDPYGHVLGFLDLSYVPNPLLEEKFYGDKRSMKVHLH